MEQQSTFDDEWDADDAGDSGSDEGDGAGQSSSGDPPSQEENADDKRRDLYRPRDDSVDEDVTRQGTSVQRHCVVHQTAGEPK